MNLLVAYLRWVAWSSNCVTVWADTLAEKCMDVSEAKARQTQETR